MEKSGECTRSIFLVLERINAHLSLISGNIADALWIALNKSNQALAETLLNLSAMYERDQVSYTNGVVSISSLQHVQVGIGS